ncbi:type II secretion system F family protein [Ileibacterium valens]|uniref:type II secretion system F family protein n=1 Tax=Ileibacterium valens TaxID=1862668 RepID=UPI00351218A6
MPISKTVLALMPFTVCLLWALWMFQRAQKREKNLDLLLRNSSMTAEEKQIASLKQQHNKQKAGFLAEMNAKMNVLGIEYKMESLIACSVLLFAIGCIGSVLIFKSGMILMVYLGILCSLSVFVGMNSLIEKKKNQLTLEFLEKMRDTATYLSIGKNLDNALYEVLTTGTISPVMERELEAVRQEIYLHQNASEAFMNMYERLQIEDIRMYARTLAVFEESGGNLITVMKANDQYATSRIEIKNSQDVFIKSQKTSQKFVIGIPLILIIGVFLINPSFFGGYYATPTGEGIAIVCITVLVLGVWLSNKTAKITI